MRADEITLRPGQCPRCLLREEVCLCAEVPRVETRTEILIVRHVFEAHRTSNTGRIAHLALSHSRLLDYGGGPDFDDAPLREPGTCLLYPEVVGPPLTEPPRRLVVLDATWRQSRKMIIRMSALRGMPRLRIAPPPMAPLRLRQPTHPEGLSTLEAIAAAVGELEGPEKGDLLRALHDEFVRRGLALRGHHALLAEYAARRGKARA